MTHPKIYFYCCDEPGNLQEDIIALAEGLKVLGIPYHASCNYWLQSPQPDDYLFRHDPSVAHQDCDVVIVPYTWPLFCRMGDFKIRRQPLPRDLFAKGRRYTTVFMDNFDGYRTISWEPEYRQFDLVLRTKYNRRAFHPDNMRPWAYGWTNRIIEATAGAMPFRERRRALLVNFGASHPLVYSARQLSRRRFEPSVNKALKVDATRDDLSVAPPDPYGNLMWRQTGARFCHSYYSRLKQSQAVAAFCGDVIPGLPWRPDRYLAGGNRARLRRAAFALLSAVAREPPRAVGCDSFRFWEALAAGCATINLDLDDYGVEMPVMPENGVHYLGLNFASVQRLVDRIADEPEVLERVAAAGHEWAKIHYSPEAAARRFLVMVSPDFRHGRGDDLQAERTPSHSPARMQVS